MVHGSKYAIMARKEAEKGRRRVNREAVDASGEYLPHREKWGVEVKRQKGKAHSMYTACRACSHTERQANEMNSQTSLQGDMICLPDTKTPLYCMNPIAFGSKTWKM